MENRFLTVYLSLLIIPGCIKVADNPKAILFIAKYDSPIVKSSFIPFAIGNTALIYSYAAGSITNNVSGTPMNAICQSGGILSTGSPLYILKGNYDFYSVSNNSSNTIIIGFTNGISSQLSNGNDYLWAGNRGFAANNGGTVTFAYRRLACKINISINGNANVSNLSVNSVWFSLPSANGIKINLSNGIVNSATSVNALSIVPGSGNTRSFICLPSVAQTQINVSLNASIDGEAYSNKIFSTLLSQSFLSGNCYDIALNLETLNSFGVSVNVKEWVSDNIVITY